MDRKRFTSLWGLLVFALVSLPSQSNELGYTKDELRQLQQRERHVAALSQSDTQETHNIIKQAQMHREAALSIGNEWQQKLDVNRLSPALGMPATENPNAAAHGIMVFVSLTMPRSSLIALLRQSEQLGIPLVIRGVLPQGFTATANRINQLLNSEKPPIKSGVAINPQWFKQFDIKAVPAFVVMKEGRCMPRKPCLREDYDIVYGNLSLYDALDILKQGDNQDIVRTHLTSVRSER